MSLFSKKESLVLLQIKQYFDKVLIRFYLDIFIVALNFILISKKKSSKKM
jgi:hypothetical protein